VLWRASFFQDCRGDGEVNADEIQVDGRETPELVWFRSGVSNEPDRTIT
jgi:hypothetical protein